MMLTCTINMIVRIIETKTDSKTNFFACYNVAMQQRLEVRTHFSLTRTNLMWQVVLFLRSRVYISVVISCIVSRLISSLFYTLVVLYYYYYYIDETILNGNLFFFSLW